jgi:hypothetical protein
MGKHLSGTLKDSLKTSWLCFLLHVWLAKQFSRTLRAYSTLQSCDYRRWRVPAALSSVQPRSSADLSATTNNPDDGVVAAIPNNSRLLLMLDLIKFQSHLPSWYNAGRLSKVVFSRRLNLISPQSFSLDTSSLDYFSLKVAASSTASFNASIASALLKERLGGLLSPYRSNQLNRFAVKNLLLRTDGNTLRLFDRYSKAKSSISARRLLSLESQSSNFSLRPTNTKPLGLKRVTFMRSLLVSQCALSLRFSSLLHYLTVPINSQVSFTTLSNQHYLSTASATGVPHSHYTLERANSSHVCSYMSSLHTVGHSVIVDPFLIKALLSPQSNPRLVDRTADSFDNIRHHKELARTIYRKVSQFVANSSVRKNISPWYYNTLIRFLSYCTGLSVMLQYYGSLDNLISKSDVALYKRWMPRMASYERSLGHRFFLEEALHVIHLSFKLHDASLFSSWLKAIISRISFWRTRSIFRFLKYLFNNYLNANFNRMAIKGFKVRLKGKISAAGNSRKRNIIFRSGKTSYSSVELKCSHSSSQIVTFTGAMGFQIWIFY